MSRSVKEATCETDVEEYLVEQVEARGGTAEKFSSPQKRSVPDRLVCWRDSWIPACAVFVECKAPGKGPSKAQARDHERRRKMGFRVYVTDTYASVDRFIKAEGFEE
jgi:hypothetical protein